METSEIVSILKEDFLDRDGETFVKARKEGRLGWENGISSGAYSEYMLRPASQEELIRNAYSVAKDMITAMDTPFRVKISITGKKSATDGRTVFVATWYFDDKDLSVGEKLDIFVGLAVHEGSHLLYSDFSLLGKVPCKAVKYLHNVIEDEMIERKLGSAKPGLACFLAATKYYYFGRYEKTLEEKPEEIVHSRIVRALDAVFSLIRYPRNLEAGVIPDFGELLLKVRDILTPYPESSSQALDAAERIWDLLSEEVKDSDGGKGPLGGTGSADDLESVIDAIEDALKEIGSTAPGVDGNGIPSALMCGEIRDGDSMIGEICEGTVEEGSIEGSLICHAEEDRQEYFQGLQEIRKYIPAIAGALKNTGRDVTLINRGMRSGNLDTSKLAEAFQGVQTVYERKGESKAGRSGVCILVDESGSMYGEKIHAAKNTAILLDQALSQAPNLSVFIYGHTYEDGYNKLFVYREPGYRKRYTLGSAEARSGNVDSIAILEAAARVRKYTDDSILFIVISDGAPCEPPANVRSAVDTLERHGFFFIAVSIEPHHDPGMMYRNNITLTDYSRLAIELGKVVKKAILKNAKRQTVW